MTGDEVRALSDLSAAKVVLAHVEAALVDIGGRAVADETLLGAVGEAIHITLVTAERTATLAYGLRRAA